jgi:probable HAF family extracellular repeat protein
VPDRASIFAQSYDNGAYAVRVDYDPPPAPLRPDDEAWADALLFRPTSPRWSGHFTAGGGIACCPRNCRCDGCRESLEEDIPMSTMAAPTYTITDLGTLPGGSQSVAHGINALGWVVGTADTANGDFHAFLAVGGPLLDLGTLGGKTSTATSLNAAGQVVGKSETAAGVIRAFLYTAHTMTDLGTLGGHNSVLHSFARGAGDRAAPAVGSAGNTAGAMRAALFNNGPLQDLGDLLGGPNSFATAANVAGLVVGGAETPTQARHAFLASISAGVVQDLGTLGGRESSATGVNTAGQVIGNSGIPGGAIHAFLHTGSGLQDLGTLGGPNSFAKAINSAGQIVGKSRDASGLTRAFLAQGAPGGSMQNLNQLVPAGSGWELIEATDINDAGQIVGYGRFQGRIRAFLLTPARA